MVLITIRPVSLARNFLLLYIFRLSGFVCVSGVHGNGRTNFSRAFVRAKKLQTTLTKQLTRGHFPETFSTRLVFL